MQKACFPFLIISIISLSFFTVSCSHNFYAPATAQTPLFREKGETQLSMHLGNGNEIEQSFQFQAAAAIDSNLAVYGNFYAARGGYKNNDDPNNNGKGSQFELALGYFNPIGARTSFELLGGTSYGMLTNNYSRLYQNQNETKTSPYTIKSDFVKPFVQGNIGYRSPFFDAVFNLRIGYLHIGGINETFTIDSGYVPLPIEDVDRIKSTPGSMVLEPGITLRAGYEPLKVQLHLGMSFNSNGDNYPQERTIFSIGVVGMFNSTTRRN